ncbi:b(0,+)-type amino acid transporter 1-like [Saccoglossus kowalevskii]|uniref:B(0,+)-type amino acid transporter 1-like n=1 Tax=Saccoglossus kowalevskii TaxID=10224 RepID=A0ABM0MAA8_SACKO|nr:PREDICTED: B(0,+)-type amino acid transporter 1-like [Saccoglossus kowalevskii]
MTELRDRSAETNLFNNSSNKDELPPKNPDTVSRVSDVELKRQVGLMSGIALIVGTMIGSGIFVSPKGVLRQTESVGMSLIIWLACGVLSMLGAVSYAELGTFIPKSGAEYAYLFEGFGGIPAFLFAWISVVILRPASVAAIALTFGNYAAQPFFPYGCEIPDIVIKLLAGSCILIIAWANCYSVRLATSVQNVFTVAKLLAIAIIIMTGFVRLGQGHTEYLNRSFEGSSTNGFAYAIAFYQGLWAYDGWNNLNYVTEEIKNPYRNLPLSIMIGIPLVTLCYLLVNISYFTVMSPDELLASSAVAVTLADRTLGVMAWIMPVFVALSTFGAANGTLFTSGRLTFVAAREGHMVEVLSMVHVKRLTPFPAVAFTSFLSILMIIPSNFDQLVNYFSFTAWLFYGGTMLALIVMRFTKKDVKRPIKVPIIIPIIVFLASIYLVIAPIIDEPALEYLYATIFIFAGLIFYIPFVYYKYIPPFMRKFTIFFQLLLEIAPTKTMPIG